MSTEATSGVKPFRFSGNGGEFFRIWIVNLLLTIVTLGIYSAWAKVRTNRYFYGNTHFDGANFEYHATPIQILKGRIIAVIALLIVVALNEVFPIAGLVATLVVMFAAPWIIWSSLRFNARMASYRNVRFGFEGGVWPVYKYLLILPLAPLVLIGAVAAGLYYLGFGQIAVSIAMSLAVLATYLMIPYVQAVFQHYYINGCRFGQGEFKADIRASFFYITYLKLVGISVLLLVGLLLLLEVLGAGFRTATVDPITALLALGPIMFVVVIGMMCFGIWSKAYYQSKIRNYLMNQTSLDDAVQMHSEMTAGSLFKLQLVNMLLMLVSLGLAYPWIKVRQARYSADTLVPRVTGDLGQYVSMQQQKQSALADELGEAFDVDADLGLSI